MLQFCNSKPEALLDRNPFVIDEFKGFRLEFRVGLDRV